MKSRLSGGRLQYSLVRENFYAQVTVRAALGADYLPLYPERETIFFMKHGPIDSAGASREISRDRENELGSFVRQRRKSGGLSQRALAELAGVGARVVWEIEKGKKTLRMDVVNSVLAVFGKRLGVVDAPRAEDEP